MFKDLLIVSEVSEDEVHLSDSESPCSSGGTVQRVSRLCLRSGVGFQNVSTVPVFLSLMKISLSCEGKVKKLSLLGLSLTVLTSQQFDEQHHRKSNTFTPHETNIIYCEELWTFNYFQNSLIKFTGIYNAVCNNCPISKTTTKNPQAKREKFEPWMLYYMYIWVYYTTSSHQKNVWRLCLTQCPSSVANTSFPSLIFPETWLTLSLLPRNGWRKERRERRSGEREEEKGEKEGEAEREEGERKK